MMFFLKKLSIKAQLFIILILIIVLMLFTIMFTYINIEKIYGDSNNEYLDRLISQVGKTVSSNCEIINSIAQNIAYNKAVQEYLMENNDLRKYELYKTVTNFIENMRGMKEGIVDIVLLGVNGTEFDINGGSWVAQQLVDKIPKEAVDPYYSGLIDFQSIDLRDKVFFVGMRVYSVIPGKMLNEQIGVLYIVIESSSLFGQGSSVETIDADIYCMDRNNYVFPSNGLSKNKEYQQAFCDYFKNKEDALNIVSIEGRNFIVNSEQIPQIEGEIAIIIPEEKLLKDFREARKSVMLFFVTAAFLLFVPLIFVCNNILQPIEKLVKFMNKISSGQVKDLNMRVDLQGYYNEMSIMASEFNRMLEQINRLTNDLISANMRIYRIELEKKKGEIAYLRSQVNPHFLYNTLESIKGIAIEESVPRIVEMCRALGRIFRYSAKGQDEVTLREELDVVKSYVKIQQIRFADRLSVKYEFYEDTMERKIPKMILQPIVENAIYHGLEMKIGQGHLYIGGYINENHELIIWVRDDGVGMDAETFNRITSRLYSNPSQTHDSQGEMDVSGYDSHNIGLINVNNRIKLIYGLEEGITINSVEGVGTEVFIKIPEKRVDNV